MKSKFIKNEVKENFLRQNINGPSYKIFSSFYVQILINNWWCLTEMKSILFENKYLGTDFDTW